VTVEEFGEILSVLQGVEGSHQKLESKRTVDASDPLITRDFLESFRKRTGRTAQPGDVQYPSGPRLKTAGGKPYLHRSYTARRSGNLTSGARAIHSALGAGDGAVVWNETVVVAEWVPKQDFYINASQAISHYAKLFGGEIIVHDTRPYIPKRLTARLGGIRRDPSYSGVYNWEDKITFPPIPDSEKDSYSTDKGNK